jgi:DNA polymerase
MNGERERMLLEMGLGPIWKLRVSVAERRVIDAREGVVADAGGVMAPQSFEPVSRSEVPAGATAVRPPSASPIAIALADDRTSVILRMDWVELREAVAGCSACGLCTTRRNTVFGVGNQAAPWMIIGEAPGAEEDARGDPFVGQAGQLLDAMLAAVGMTRERDVFIANVLKCRPPGNRNPDPQEVARCLPHLLRQVALVKPQLILLMGRFAAHAMLATEASIASLRGRVHPVASIPAIVTYHPAYLLRTPLDKAKSWEDLVFARATWKALQSTADSPTLAP